ncbi:hypothetical protein PGTUg99_007725 [Puccinia graminis f. sp. tritici]|uniref:Uncharacterized protein n=1 Tax=Puccinia graminis f. sp. tritici TaxID=56615 RepID=A0A5B0LHB7_PUCGR|nr:hypothetical protein PGTUg99_007725 [Puccinia graminis f. sp. tritici]
MKSRTSSDNGNNWSRAPCSLPIPLQPAVYNDHHASRTDSFDVTGESALPVSLEPAVAETAVAEPAVAEHAVAEHADSDPAVAKVGVGNSDI